MKTQEFKLNKIKSKSKFSKVSNNSIKKQASSQNKSKN